MGGGCDKDKKGDCFHSPVVVVAWLRNFVIHLRGVLRQNGRSPARGCGIWWVISICQNDTDKSKLGQIFFFFHSKGILRDNRDEGEMPVAGCGFIRLVISIDQSGSVEHLRKPLAGQRRANKEGMALGLLSCWQGESTT